MKICCFPLFLPLERNRLDDFREQDFNQESCKLDGCFARYHPGALITFKFGIGMVCEGFDPGSLAAVEPRLLKEGR
jgi:hypothetical protein